MKIITDTDLKPNIIKYLQKIKDKDLFYKEHGLKHPLALYNTSLNKIEEALQDFFKTYDELTIGDFTPDGKKNDKGKNLLKTYKTFLYSLREYLDDCFSIIKTFISPRPFYKKDRNQYNWLRKNVSSQLGDFFNKIKEYKNYLDNIVNHLKHRNAIMNYVVFYEEILKEFCVGYFVANVINNTYEPVEDIHTKFKGQHTAFSFNRDIRYNIYNIFFISEAIIEVLNDLNISVDTLDTVIKKASERETNLYKKVMDMPKKFFPDEYFKKVPSACLLEGGNLKLEYPSNLSLQKLNLGKILLTHSGDGKTRTFRILYH